MPDRHESRDWVLKVDWLRCLHEATVACFGPEHALFATTVIANPQERARVSEAVLAALLDSCAIVGPDIGFIAGSNRAIYLEYLLEFVRECLLEKPYQQVFLLSCDIEATLTYVAFDLTEAGDELADEFHRLRHHVEQAVEFVPSPQTQEEWRRFVACGDKPLRMPKLLAAIRASKAEPENILLRELIAYDPNKPGTTAERRSV
ncbi:MAG: hypothetical protein KJ947_11170 [Alphaproteobacteria bacterium]|jgi:hypothetical protein|nr:hypothetical protein [Alphaproteobacteria bacterium]MBU1550117.1 hypothetical protein [Alphaproteobacteria bacterium]MBU2337081.1 hypothetical protein [Alphaproteobacteria bacterium]MBU2389412.1 hypothetical protein [Alphaproteobacteria bacterium]